MSKFSVESPRNPSNNRQAGNTQAGTVVEDNQTIIKSGGDRPIVMAIWTVLTAIVCFYLLYNDLFTTLLRGLYRMLRA